MGTAGGLFAFRHMRNAFRSATAGEGFTARGFTAHGLRCIGCGAAQAEAAREFRCPACGDLLEVVYTAPEPWNPGALQTLWRERKTSLDPAAQSGVWRFREMLPILADPAAAVTLREGNTPLYEMPRCAKFAGVDALLAKHQGMNPTGSFKDTGMTAALSVAKEKGFEWVGCASTGNTSASMAAYAARAGMRALVLLPEGKISWGKLAQSLEYGARTLQLKTDFDGCVRVLLELVRRFPLYLLNSMNPYRLEGQKTAAFELMEQLGWRVPQHVIVPGGNLANSSALGKGFREMLAAGLIDRLPRLSIVQAEGANPLVRAVRDLGGERIEPVQAETRATAIRIGNPASWKKAVAVLRESGGACLDVSEDEIADAKRAIGIEGIGCRAGFGRHARRPEEAGWFRLRAIRRFGGAGSDRPLPQRSGIHVGTMEARRVHRCQRGCSDSNARGRGIAAAMAQPVEIVLPATSANLGPAFDAAAIAMRLHFRVRAREAGEFTIDARGRDAAICGSVERNLVLETYAEVLADCDKICVPLAIEVENEIPVGKGLGSSAAARLAGIALAAHFGGLGWSDARILAEAMTRERHGDNAAACWLGGVALVHAEGAVKLRVRAEWPLLVAVTQAPLSTEHARSVLPPTYTRADAVSNLQCSMLLIAAFLEGRADWIRLALRDRIHEPYRGPLCPLLEPLRSLSGEHGVLGAALSGSGPSVLVVLDPKADAAETRGHIARFLEARGLEAELLLTSMETHGARDRRWAWSGTSRERRPPIPLP